MVVALVLLQARRVLRLLCGYSGVGETRRLSFGGALLGLGVTSVSPFHCFEPALGVFSPAASLCAAFPCPSPSRESRRDWVLDWRLPSPSMCQPSSSPDLSGDGGEDRRFPLVGELAGDEAGEASSGEEGGEGGCAGRSLCRGLIWRMTGRLSSLLVNGRYYAFLTAVGWLIGC